MVDKTYSASYPAGRDIRGKIRDPDRSGSPTRRQFQENQTLIISIIVAFLTVFYVSSCATKALQNEVAGLKRVDNTIQQVITDNRNAADAAFQAAENARNSRAADVDESFKNVNKALAAAQKSLAQSIDATNEEVESVKGVVASLDARVSSDLAGVRGAVNAVSGDLSNTNSRVSANSARAEQIYQEITQVAGGLESFYNDIKDKTEWAVHGPGGCNDPAPKGGLDDPWKETRSFVHTKQKVTLENCKMLCKRASWGCNYVTFYGANIGWCYGFQSCDKHSTGQGWGGYTTYERKSLKPLGGDE